MPDARPENIDRVRAALHPPSGEVSLMGGSCSCCRLQASLSAFFHHASGNGLMLPSCAAN